MEHDAVTRRGTTASDDRRAIRLALAMSVLSALAVLLVYLVFVRTKWGQEVDDLAFEGRAAVSPEATARLNRMLNSITEASLVVLGGGIVLVALFQRRLRLAFAVGACMAGAVVTTEVLKLHVFTRPSFDDVQGIAQNSYPSGHATIGMVLSLGLVMVSTSRWRRFAAVAAALQATLFGTAVLATGWHRPSDTFGAYGVALAWFAAGHAALLWSDMVRPYGRGMARMSDRPPSKALLGLAAAALVAIMVVNLVRSLDTGGLHTVEFAGWYIITCLAIDAVGVAMVLGFAVLTGERARHRRDAALGQPTLAAEA